MDIPELQKHAYKGDHQPKQHIFEFRRFGQIYPGSDAPIAKDGELQGQSFSMNFKCAVEFDCQNLSLLPDDIVHRSLSDTAFTPASIYPSYNKDPQPDQESGMKFYKDGNRVRIEVSMFHDYFLNKEYLVDRLREYQAQVKDSNSTAEVNEVKPRKQKPSYPEEWKQQISL